MKDIKALLAENPDLEKYLFIRGFLLTDNPGLSTAAFPFSKHWQDTEWRGWHFWRHELTGFHCLEREGRLFFIFGHAYDPFSMEIDEDRILAHFADAFKEASGNAKFSSGGLLLDGSPFREAIDNVTGVFVLGWIDGSVHFLVDPSGMQSACCGTAGGRFYCSSHPQMVADICGLEMAPFVRKLVAYKWYPRVMGPYLPADLTPFAGLKRVVPNIAYSYAPAGGRPAACQEEISSGASPAGQGASAGKGNAAAGGASGQGGQGGAISHRRFYPLKDLPECRNDAEYRQVIADAAAILKKNMELVLRKWKNPWQSLTGGIDSNTTFAAANGHYGQYRTFSYFSAEKESIDCDAAKKISAHFGVPWTLYEIPEQLDPSYRFEEKAAILQHNNGHITPCRKQNELRKRMVLERDCPADVEIKSWVSETIRCYWYKHYGRTSMPPLSSKLFRNLYKIFIFNRPLAWEIDKLFAKYIEEFEYAKVPAQYPPADLHFNEVTWGSWGGLGISEMKFCFDITFIYNNRKFLDLLFRVPLEKRISDQHHLDMKKVLNKDLYDMGIRVVNMRETKFRAFALNVLFTINSWLAF